MNHLSSRSRAALRFLLALILYFLIFFSVSYKSFYFFDLDRDTGQFDSISYVSMHDGNYHVSPIHRYRIGIPLVASRLTHLLGVQKTDQLQQENAPSVRFSFLVVNTAIVALTASISLLIGLRVARNVNPLLAFAAICISFMNPVTIQNMSTPLVDAAVPLFSILLLFTVINNASGFSVPIVIGMILFNERIIAYLPLLLVGAQSFRKRLSQALILAFDVVLAFLFHHIIKLWVDLHLSSSAIFALNEARDSLSLFGTIVHHSGNTYSTLSHYARHPLVLIRHLFVDFGAIQISSAIVVAFVYSRNRLLGDYAHLGQIFRSCQLVLIISVVLVLFSGDVSRMLSPIVPFMSILSIVLANEADISLRMHRQG